MPRKSIAETPMTSAERVRKHRAKLKAENTKIDPEIPRLLSETEGLKKQIENLKAELEASEQKAKTYEGFMTINKILSSQLKTANNYIKSATKTGHIMLSEQDIKLLKQLCHPDKHGQSEASKNGFNLVNNLKPNSP